MEIEDEELEIQLEPEGILIAPVTSVNGKTGDVVLKTSDLENDSNYQNANDVANSIGAHNQSFSAHQDIRQLITDEATTRLNADNSLQGQIDAITSASDVVDIVGTYAELEAYDTQHLKDNDVIKVLQDETHNDAMAYYRWSTQTETWTYIGSEGPYYTKSETNTLLDGKLNISDVPDGFFDGPATINPESSVSVTIEGSIKLKDVKLLGNTNQLSYTGKNLWGGYTAYSRTSNDVDFVINSNGSLTAQGIASSVAYSITGQVAQSNGTYITLNAGTYYLSCKDPRPTGVSVQIVETTASTIIRDGVGSFTLTETTNVCARLKVASGTDLTDGIIVYPQVELSSTSTSYEPYVGGIVSPNPSYPQTINVVTGTQTISVTDDDSQSQSYTVNLGSIELCKLGTYQDYIYKSGNDWYIHKEIDKVTFTGTADETWSAGNNNVYFYHTVSGTYTPENRSSKALILSDYYTVMTYNQVASTTIDYGIALDSNNTGRFAIRNKDCANSTAFKTWLAANNTTVYYPLGNATDTQITDNTLIGQLENVLNATIYSPTTIMNSSGILPAILGVEAFTDNLNSLLEIASEPTPEPVTYEDFVGTDGVNAGTNGLVPAPLVTDVDKFLKSDGTWGTVGGGGGSTNCRELTSADYNYPTNNPTTVALWLLEPGLYWWEFTFADNGGITFTTTSSLNSNLKTYSVEVLIGYSGDKGANTLKTIYAYNRSPGFQSASYGFAPFVPYRVNSSTGASVNFTTDAIPVGRGDVNI